MAATGPTAPATMHCATGADAIVIVPKYNLHGSFDQYNSNPKNGKARLFQKAQGNRRRLKENYNHLRLENINEAEDL
jgi:hypothetical protein